MSSGELDWLNTLSWPEILFLAFGLGAVVGTVANIIRSVTK
jgi:hypothetical protein